MRPARRLLATAAVASCACLVAQEIGAVVTFFDPSFLKRITLRVGSPSSAVDSVVFNVNNANVSPSPVPVTGVPSGPGTSPTGGVEIDMLAELSFLGNTPTQVNLTVDSSSPLVCLGGSGCGTTTIPINNISWQSFNRDTQFPGLDIGPGTFSGSANQTLASIATGSSLRMSNVLVFSYSNATLFPAGEYRSRIRYTASMP